MPTGPPAIRTRRSWCSCTAWAAAAPPGTRSSGRSRRVGTGSRGTCRATARPPRQPAGWISPLSPVRWSGYSTISTPRRLHLVGLSFGGMHAQHVALAHPERIASLTLVDTSPAFGLDGTTRAEWLSSRLDAIRPRHRCTGTVVGRHRRGRRAAPSLRRASRDRVSTTASLHSVASPSMRSEPHVTVWSITISAADSAASRYPRWSSWEHSTPRHRRPTPRPSPAEIPGARLVEVPDAGHLVPAEAPEVFNRLLLDFLAEV